MRNTETDCMTAYYTTVVSDRNIADTAVNIVVQNIGFGIASTAAGTYFAY